MSLTGRVVIITGGAGGIGAAAGHRFAESGAHVVLVDIAKNQLGAKVEAIRRNGGVAEGFVADIAEPSEVVEMVDQVIHGFGRIDVLYNNAGGPTSADGDITEIDEAGWVGALRVDLFGTIICSRTVIPHMKAASWGSIVNTSSMVAVRGVSGRDAYVVAKGAIIALTRSMAAEFGEFGITVNAVAPGVTRSERVIRALMNDNRTKALVDRHVTGLVEPDEIAALAVFLASDGARKITGQVFSVDSGATQILTSQR